MNALIAGFVVCFAFAIYTMLRLFWSSRKLKAEMPPEIQGWKRLWFVPESTEMVRHLSDPPIKRRMRHLVIAFTGCFAAGGGLLIPTAFFGTPC